MIRNDQVYTNPNLWPVFPPSKYSPIFSPLPYPTFPRSPDLFTVFFFTPCPVLLTHCMLLTWMIAWWIPLKDRRPIAIGFGANLSYDLQVSQNLFIMVHYGDQESILEEPSLSFHDIVFVFDIPWASDEMKETQRSLPDHTWTQCTNQILSLPLLSPR